MPGGLRESDELPFKVFLMRGRQWWPYRHAATLEQARANVKAGLAEWGKQVDRARIMKDFKVLEEVKRR